MKKVLLFTVSFMFLAFSSFSQTSIYEDDFESYNVGEYLAEQSTEWTTWSGAPGTAEDALISDAQANSPTKSVIVDGTTDLVKPFGNKTSGRYEVSFYYYVPSGYYGYYNLQHFEQPGVEWALEVFFEDGGTGYINAGGDDAATFNYTQDAWVEVTNIIDLTNDTAELIIEGTWVHGWQFSLQADGTAGTLQLGSANHYAWAPSGGEPMYYFDDYMYEQVPIPLFVDDFESYNVDEYLAEQSDWWDTWSGNPGSAEDGLIIDEYSHSPDQSVEVTGSTDLIGPFGNKTSGQYEVNFWVYVPTDYAGYYNFQHYETPGVEWAMEVYFTEGDQGYLDVGGERYFFDYSHDEWVYVRNVINIDEDLGQLYINDGMVHEWPWHYTTTSTDGINQLGGIDVFAGAPQGETPLYYFDDFEWIETSSSQDPVIAVTPMEFNQYLDPGGTTTDDLFISNEGAADLEWNIDIYYNLGGAKTAVAPSTGNQKAPKRVELAKSSTPTNGGEPAHRDDVVLHYDGENDNAIGLTDPNQWEVAAKFLTDEVAQYAGMEIISVDVYINDVVNEYKLRIYGEGEYSYEPGDLLIEQDFTPTASSWNTILLDEPILLTGEDIWVGYWMDQTTTETFPAGIDAGPGDPNGDWIKSGVAWGHLNDSPSFNSNWNIRAYATGDPIYNWLSADPESGTIEPDGEETVVLTFDATELTEGSYSATVQVNSNDNTNHLIEIEATLDVFVGIDENGENNAVLVYPNPSTSYVNINANHKITDIKMMNYVGQVVYQENIDHENARIQTSDIPAGVYILQINTEAGVSTQQIVIE
ncbi:MAG: T9SS type A sorting domain-containing protein [Bacteroidales bacterium]|nr:T9SS type A sorting domain-containing protein [Bacteroidales bacterium]MCF8343751.1 T9SS type A sorting domain-containing protein [Bacteroidales bacterium]